MMLFLSRNFWVVFFINWDFLIMFFSSLNFFIFFIVFLQNFFVSFFNPIPFPISKTSNFPICFFTISKWFELKWFAFNFIVTKSGEKAFIAHATFSGAIISTKSQPLLKAAKPASVIAPTKSSEPPTASTNPLSPLWLPLSLFGNFIWDFVMKRILFRQSNIGNNRFILKFFKPSFHVVKRDY